MQKGVIPLELFRLLGTIAINKNEAIEDINETTDTAQKAGGKMSSAFKKIGTAVVAAFAVDKIKDFGLKCIETAAAVKATNSQFEQSFGDMQQAASDAINRVAKDSGIVETRLKGIGTSIYAFAKTTGMESAEALGMMEEALQVAADSAAYYDRSLEDTSESLKSFLKCNFENDAALGLSCTETTRNAAANKLYGKSFKDLSESQKQLTLLQMVKDANELSGAMGQAARESDGWENVTGNLKESLNQLYATIGKPVLSAAVPVVKAMASGIEWLNQKVGEAIEKFGDTGLGKALKEFATVAVPILQAAYDNIIKPVFEAIVLVIRDIAIPIFQYLIETITQLVVVAQEKFGFLQPLIEGAMNAIKGIITAVSALIKGDWKKFWDSIVKTVKELGSALHNAGKEALDSLFDGMKSVWKSISDWVSEKVDWIIQKWEKLKEALLNMAALLKKNVGEAAETQSKRKSSTSTTSKTAKHAEGGILTKPTIFGYTPSTDTWHLGGEAGAEAIAPIDVLQGYVRSAVAAEMSGGIQTMIGLLEKLVDKDTSVYLNSKEISQAVNKDLGVAF